ncbi:MAG TPA: radical SAM protein, partial [Nitriliruptorales bacterium]
GLADRRQVETVQLTYRAGWRSYCISSQVGCGLGCTFCATGTMGLARNLTVDEITDQILWFWVRGDRVDRVSFMGMGEALANPATFEAIEVFTAPDLFALSPRRVTVSTVGLLPGLQRLVEEHPRVGITFSLHSPFGAQRAELVPLHHRYPTDEILDVLDRHVRDHHTEVTLAYTLMADLNDSPEHAHALASLLRARGGVSRRYHLTVIGYNDAPVLPDRFAAPSRSTLEEFAGTVRSAGIRTTIRAQFGTEVGAGCGQLAGRSASAEAAGGRPQRGTTRSSRAATTPLVRDLQAATAPRSPTAVGLQHNA